MFHEWMKIRKMWSLGWRIRFSVLFGKYYLLNNRLNVQFKEFCRGGCVYLGLNAVKCHIEGRQGERRRIYFFQN